MTTKLQENNCISTSVLNREFRIKVYSTNDKGKSINSLRGHSGLIKLLGESLAIQTINKAFSSGERNPEFRFRRGLKVTFYTK